MSSDTSVELLGAGEIKKGEHGVPVVRRSVAVAFMVSTAVFAIAAAVMAGLFARSTMLMNTQPQLVSMMPTAWQGVVVQEFPGGASASKPIAWNYDQAAGLNEVVYNYAGANEFRVITSGSNQYVISGNQCQEVAVEITARPKNFVAQSIVPASQATTTVNGRQCTFYIAERYDHSVFNFSIDASGALCQIGDDGETYTFQTDAPAPTFYGANPTVCIGNSNAAESLMQTDSIWGWAKCHLCTWLAGKALDAAVDGGCGLLSGGTLIAICNAAIDTGCDLAHCTSWICDHIHMC